MNSFRIGAWVVAAVLVFWAVGAYNRLVRLRSRIVESFGAVDEHLIARDLQLHRHIDAVGGVLAQATERLEALRAACQQTDTARAHARAHPGAPGAIASLRLADEILGEARARLPVQSIGGLDLSALNAELAASDTALDFARRRFNAAVEEYNLAVRQIPTRLMAALFGFAPAATL